MKFLFGHHRQFNDFNLMGHQMVFKLDNPKSSVNVKKNKPSSRPTSIPTKPYAANDFKKHEDGFKTGVAKLPDAIKKLHGKNFNQAFNTLKSQYQSLFNKPKNSDLQNQAQALHQKATELLSKIRAHHPQVSVQPKAAPKSKEASKKPSKLMQVISKLTGVKDPIGLAYIEKVALPTLKLTDLQERQIEKGSLQLTPQQKKVLQKSLPVSIKSPTPQEFKLIKNFIGNNKLSSFFKEFKSPAFQVLSRRYDFKKIKGKLTVYKYGKKLKILNKPEDLIDLFDPALKAQFKAYQKNSTPDDKAKLEKHLAKRNTEYKAFLKMKQALFPDDKPKSHSVFGKITMLFALYKKVMDSIKGNNFKELQDYLSAWNQAKDPKKLMEMINGAGEHYKKELEKRDPKADFKLLLKAYLNPYGKKANLLFTLSEKGSNQPKLMRFRSQARKPILIHITNRLLKLNAGTSQQITRLAGVRHLPGGTIQVVAYTKKGKVAIEINDQTNLRKVPVYPYLNSGKGAKKTEVKSNKYFDLDLSKF